MGNSEAAGLECLANCTTGICIISMTPILLGLPGATLLGALPWLAASLPIFLICSIWLFKAKAMLGGFATAILSGITLIGNAYTAMMELYIEANNLAVTAEQWQSIRISSASVMFAAAMVLLILSKLSFSHNKAQALFLSLACLGFFGVSLQQASILDFGLIPGVLLLLFALWQLYSGLGMLVINVQENKRLPFLT